MKRFGIIWSLMLLLWAAVGMLQAQVNTATITGFVSDHAGASIPGAQIRAESAATGLRYSAVSATNGAYTLSLLPPGTYQITAEASGFTKFVVHSFGPLTVGQAARLDIALQVGALTQTISVTAKTPLVDAENGTMGSVVNRTSIESLPLNGRDPYGLMSLVANVNFSDSTFLDYSGFHTNTVSINGGQSGSNEFLIDGAPTNSLQENEPVISPNTSMVEEFRILTNSPQAEYGPTGGGVISMVTRSGTNQLHGNAYEFLRNDAFDADTWANNRLGLGKPVLRYNQFGGSLGGPVVIPKIYHGKNKTFFFANYETTLDNTTATNLTRVPTTAEQSGDFSHTFIKSPTTKQIVPVQIYDPQTTRPNPTGTGYIRDVFLGALIPPTRLDPVALNASKYYPGPNRPPSDATGANNYTSTPAVTKTIHQFMGRIDHQFTESNRLFLRDIIIWENSTGNPPEFSAADVGDPEYATSTSQNWQFVAGDTDTLSPTTINEFRFSMIREALRSSVPSYGLGLPQKLGLPASYPAFLFPQFDISGVSGIGNRPDKLANRSQTTGVLSDTLTKVWGSHSLKIGFDLRHEYNNNFQPGAISGSFSFGSAQSGDPQNPEATGFGYASFLLGAVGSGSLTSPYTPANAVHYYAGFVQDDWKATKDLTLNLGVRYDYFGPPAERYDRYSNFNPTAINALTGLPGVVQFADADFGRSVLHPNHRDFAPRFGFAWDIFGKNKMVVRGGYGIFYYSGPATMILGPTMGFQSTTTYTSQTQFPAFQLSQGVPFINPPAGVSGGATTFLGGSPSFLEPNRPTPYAQQWNFGLQYSLPLQSVLEVTYAGNHTVHAPAHSYSLNQLAPQYLSLGFALQNQVANPFQDLGIFGDTISRQQSLLQFPAYNSVTDSNPDYGNSIYHSVLVRFQKRTGHGLTFMASFTGSKLIGDIGHRYDAWVSGAQDANCNPDPLYNRRVCRSIEPLDIPQRLVVSTTYELPFGKGKSMLNSGFLSAVLGGWQTDAIFQVRKGNPVIVTGANNNASSIPNYVRNAALPSSERSASEWFDTEAFAEPPLFTYGNAPRTLPNVRNPGYKSLDFSLIRNIRFEERFNLQIRAEAFNVFNWVNLGPPSANFLSSTFGQITSSQPGRILQFGAHLAW